MLCTKLQDPFNRVRCPIVWRRVNRARAVDGRSVCRTGSVAVVAQESGRQQQFRRHPYRRRRLLQTVEPDVVTDRHTLLSRAHTTPYNRCSARATHNVTTTYAAAGPQNRKTENSTRVTIIVVAVAVA